MVCIMKAVSQATARYSPIIGTQTLVPRSDWPAVPTVTGRQIAAKQSLSPVSEDFLGEVRIVILVIAIEMKRWMFGCDGGVLHLIS